MKKLLLLISLSAAFACQKKEEVYPTTSQQVTQAKTYVVYDKDWRSETVGYTYETDYRTGEKIRTIPIVKDFYYIKYQRIDNPAMKYEKSVTYEEFKLTYIGKEF